LLLTGTVFKTDLTNKHMPFRIIMTAMLLKDENALESYKTQYLSEKKGL